MLQKIEGIDKPALGTENFDFVFTRKVNKNIGFLPCWYSASVLCGRPGVGHGRPEPGRRLVEAVDRPLPAAGAQQARRVAFREQLAITMALPLPQLPQSVHDVSIDNTLS